MQFVFRKVLEKKDSVVRGNARNALSDSILFLCGCYY